MLTNWPTDDDGNPVVEHFEVTNNPENEADGTRSGARSRGELFIEQDDFRADPPPKYFRLTPGREVRLRGAYLVTCTGFETDDDGNVTTVLATYDPETKGGSAPDGRKVKSTMHWVSAAHAVRRPSRCTSGCSRPRCRARRPATRSTTSTRTRASC